MATNITVTKTENGYQTKHDEPAQRDIVFSFEQFENMTAHLANVLHERQPKQFGRMFMMRGVEESQSPESMRDELGHLRHRVANSIKEYQELMQRFNKTVDTLNDKTERFNRVWSDNCELQKTVDSLQKTLARRRR